MRAKIFAVGVGVVMPFLLLLVLLLHYGEGKRCSNFRRWCRRCVAVFTAAQIFAVGVRVALPFLLLVLLLHYGEGKRCPNFRRVGVMLPTSLLLVPPLHYREVKCCSNFRRWCWR